MSRPFDLEGDTDEHIRGCCYLGRVIGVVIKLTTVIGILIIAIDIMILMGVFEIGSTWMIIKNTLSIANAILFSLSCTLYIFKFNQDILHNDFSNLCEYYKNSDLRVKGLEIIEEVEKLGFDKNERFMFRDSILFRAKLKHFGFVLEILFFYFNAMAYGKLYYYGPSNDSLGDNSTVLNRDEVYMLNLYISVISPLLSIIISYITVLCDNIAVAKKIIKDIIDNRNHEDHLMKVFRRIVNYPFLSVFSCWDEIVHEPIE